MITKHDMEGIAGVLRANRSHFFQKDYNELVEDFANWLCFQNVLFNRMKFYEAAGYWTIREMVASDHIP